MEGHSGRKELGEGIGSVGGLQSATGGVSWSSGAEGDRTLNLRIANAALSQLSYRPIEVPRRLLAYPPGRAKASFLDIEHPAAMDVPSTQADRSRAAAARPGTNFI